MMYIEPRELFDRAIVGFTTVNGEDVVVYSDTEIVELLCQEDGMTLDEAREYFDFNIAGGLYGAWHATVSVSRIVLRGRVTH